MFESSVAAVGHMSRREDEEAKDFTLSVDKTIFEFKNELSFLSLILLSRFILEIDCEPVLCLVL